VIFGSVDFWPLKNFILDGFWQNTFAWGTLILFLGVPLVGFIIWLLRRIMRIKSSGGYLGWTFGGLWTLGWISLALLSASITNDFSANNNKRPGIDVPVVQPVNGKMIVKISEPEVEYSGSIPWLHIDGRGIDVTSDTFRLSNVRVAVQKSNDSSYHVEIKKYSRGRTVPEAQQRADEAKFNYSYADSVLDIGSGFAISKESKYRDQRIIVVIQVPVGKKIRFDETMDKLHAVNIRIRGRNYNRWDRDWNFNSDEYFDYDTNVDYIMGKDGYPVDTEKPANRRNRDDYRYQDDENKMDSISVQQEIQRQIDEEKRQKEEEIRNRDNKIKELIKEKEQQSHRTTFKINTKATDHGMAIAPSLASSMASTFF
jgi:hypothetical protein